MWIPLSSLSGYAGSADALCDQQSDENPLPNMQQQKSGTVNGKAEVSCWWLTLFHCLILSKLLVSENFVQFYFILQDKGR